MLFKKCDSTKRRPAAAGRRRLSSSKGRAGARPPPSSARCPPAAGWQRPRSGDPGLSSLGPLGTPGEIILVPARTENDSSLDLMLFPEPPTLLSGLRLGDGAGARWPWQGGGMCRGFRGPKKKRVRSVSDDALTAAPVFGAHRITLGNGIPVCHPKTTEPPSRQRYCDTL